MNKSILTAFAALAVFSSALAGEVRISVKKAPGGDLVAGVVTPLLTYEYKGDQSFSFNNAYIYQRGTLTDYRAINRFIALDGENKVIGSCEGNQMMEGKEFWMLPVNRLMRQGHPESITIAVITYSSFGDVSEPTEKTFGIFAGGLDYSGPGVDHIGVENAESNLFTMKAHYWYGYVNISGSGDATTDPKAHVGVMSTLGVFVYDAYGAVGKDLVYRIAGAKQGAFKQFRIVDEFDNVLARRPKTTIEGDDLVIEFAGTTLEFPEGSSRIRLQAVPQAVLLRTSILAFVKNGDWKVVPDENGRQFFPYGSKDRIEPSVDVAIVK